MPVRVEFEPSTLLPGEQPAITTACTTAWNNYPQLHIARTAVVYSSGGRQWWHKNKNDPKEHVTVRYLPSQTPGRVHVYRDGTALLNPSPTHRSAVQEETDEDYDSVPPFSDEEGEGDTKAPDV
ncbi:hypothetical protein PsYK624_157620 [Phanerochaete sordida]|uniref:Uncharacterized protein n=1 Tax=Phanerochaete sordida TaxID=48140 RepID=A0A9P3GPH8_9APHY|nr:hypothetical protein PsYK624_157620 [Phanerochaete sordida]